MVGEIVKEYKFTDDEIQFIEIAISQQILNARKEIEKGKNLKFWNIIKKEYKKLLNTIETSKRYAKNIDKED